MFQCGCNFNGIWLQCSHWEASSQAELLCIIDRNRTNPVIPVAVIFVVTGYCPGGIHLDYPSMKSNAFFFNFP